jgi:AdoMet-dependent rRNA methyltransferase SPB1
VPSWFADDERRHWRAHVPAIAEALREYRERQHTTDTRPIKKVAEAKARKKKRAERRMARTQKRSETIADNLDLSAAEKQRQVVKSVVRAPCHAHMYVHNMH